MRISVFDLHCDTPSLLWLRGESLQKNSGAVSLQRARSLSSYMQFFAFCPFGDEMRRYAAWSAEQRFCAMLRHFGSVSEELQKTENVTAYLSLEGAEAIGCDEGRLEPLWRQGFRMTTLTWNYSNALAGPHTTEEGLTQAGRRFVCRAQKIGMQIDVSHLSERAFWDLCDITSAPLAASHSNSRACCGHSRNLSDAQARALIAQGGMIGINLYAPFLNESGRATFDDVFLHIAHFLELGGEENLALGGDLDGCDCLPQNFSGVDSYPTLAEALVQRGLSRETVEALFYRNAARFFAAARGRSEDK